MGIAKQIAILESDHILDPAEHYVLMRSLYALTRTREQALDEAMKRIQLSIEYRKKYEPYDTYPIERLEALRAAFEALGKER